jgi:hypothetical protein
VCYDPHVKVRAITYRLAGTAFVFAALWFIIGAIVLWSPLPGSMGIAGPMFAAWFVLFFLALAIAGSLLTIAALNAAFPTRAAANRRASPARPASSTVWAPPQGPRTPSGSGSSPRES